MSARLACFVVFSAALAADTPSAEACGGTFCDAPGPSTPPDTPPMTVDQTGENILFVSDGAYVEAHVQIQYTGSPESFAWIVPVPAEPEVLVGSQPLFLNLLNGSVPAYRLSFESTASCGGSGSGRRSSGGGFGCGAMSASSDSDAGYGFGATATSGGGELEPEEDTDIVEAQEAVGAFDVTVLHATTAPEISAWLTDNGFLAEDEAEPILQDYIDRDHRFVAVRLLPGNGVDEIHPLVIRYLGTEPCIPIVLTRIAAKDDMAVRAFFLGDRRMVPTGGYKHVELNPLKLDWLGLAKDYVAEVSMAMDAEAAGGHAFLTEYAGPSDVVTMSGVWSSDWDPRAFDHIEPQYAIQELQSQGLANCTISAECVMLHPLIIPLLRAYLPAPESLGEAEFYAALYQDPVGMAELVDPTAWDGGAFASDLASLVVEPGRRARDLLERTTYLTRLFTTISPDEMTFDPTFAPAQAPLDDVTGMREATQTFECDGTSFVTLPDGRDVALTNGAMPVLSDMPDVQRIEEYDAGGTLVGVVDYGTDIDAKLQIHNEGKLNGIEVSSAREESGCSCRAASAVPPAPTAGLAALLGLGILRRLRRRWTSGRDRDMRRAR
jgi:MYXO-CTERM domain-containing protein